MGSFEGEQMNGILTKSRSLERQRGVMSIEAIVVLAVLLAAIAGVGTWIRADADQRDNQNAADSLNTVFRQATVWFNQNYAMVQAAANPTVTYDWATFTGGTSPMSPTNIYGQTYSLRFFKDSSGQMNMLLLTTGGSAISEGNLRSIAKILGGAGGFVAATTPGNATGAMGGWNAVLSNYGGSPGAGHLAAAGFFANAAAVSNYLSRVVVPNFPEANQMETAIDMNGNNLNSAGTVNAQKVVTPTGGNVQVGNSQYYGDTQNSAVRQNGAFYVQHLDGTAADSSAANVSASQDVVAGRNIWASNGYVTSAALHTTGSAQIDGNASVNGTLTGSGRVNVGEFLYLGGVGYEGWGCSPNGLVGQDGGGTILACRGGVWTKVGGVPTTITVSSGDWQSSGVAACPASYTVMGGSCNMMRGGDGRVVGPQYCGPSGNAWTCSETNTGQCIAYAICGK